MLVISSHILWYLWTKLPDTCVRWSSWYLVDLLRFEQASLIDKYTVYTYYAEYISTVCFQAKMQVYVLTQTSFLLYKINIFYLFCIIAFILSSLSRTGVTMRLNAIFIHSRLSRNSFSLFIQLVNPDGFKFNISPIKVNINHQTQLDSTTVATHTHKSKHQSLTQNHT